MPKISVIVPVYNTEKYLRKCLDSIVNQDYRDVEIIIVNDGSTDGSEEIIQEYKSKYPEKIKTIKKENGGLSSARNCGVEIATGEYIAFVDSDDYIDKNLFKELLPYIDDKVDLIKFKLIKKDEQYKEIEKVGGPCFNKRSGEDAFNLLVFKDVLMEPACIYLYKKEFYKENNFKFLENAFHEDFGLIPIILVNAESAVSVDFYGYYYMQTNDSITRNEDYLKKLKRTNDLLLHYDNMIEKIDKMNLKKETRCKIKQYYTNSILLAIKSLENTEQKKYIEEIKKRKLIKNIKITNKRTFIKKMILGISIKLYFNLK